MTDTPKSPTYLLAEAAHFLNRRLDSWPDEFLPSELMLLMAGDYETHKSEFQCWRRIIFEAMEAQKLTYHCPDNGLPIYWLRPSDSLPIGQMIDRNKWNSCDRLFINRHQFAAWLRGIGEDPSEHVRAWLGDAWEKKAAKVGASYATERWTTLVREIGEAWMHEQERETGKRPTRDQIAEYLGDEVSSRNICGARGEWPSAATISRMALKGITGRKPGDNLRRASKKRR